MDSASLRSLTPLLDGIDKWVELAPLLPVLVSLELVLSADNAVALASITKGLGSLDLQRKALNFGVIIALLLRVVVILTAQFVLSFWPIQLLGSLYLLLLCYSKLNKKIIKVDSTDPSEEAKNDSLLNVILLISLTDLAFSIDSITAAVAISDQTLLVITGAVIGVIALRFTSDIFIGLLERYDRLENAGYIAVGLIGFKLLIKLVFANIVIPEYIIFLLMLCIFIWGFSIKTE